MSFAFFVTNHVCVTPCDNMQIKQGGNYWESMKVTHQSYCCWTYTDSSRSWGNAFSSQVARFVFTLHTSVDCVSLH